MKPNALRITLILMIVIAAVTGYFMITGKYGSISQAYNTLVPDKDSLQNETVVEPGQREYTDAQWASSVTTGASQGVCYNPTPEPGQTLHSGQDMKCEPASIVISPVEIAYNPLRQVWDYLEYGKQTDLGFYPENTHVTFDFDNGDFHIAYRMPLEPKQVRALADVFKSTVTHKNEGYLVNATVARGEVFSINWVEDAKGNIVWSPEMTKGPRELNAYEKWAIDYATAKGYDWLIGEWFDTYPECAAPGSLMPDHMVVCSTPDWSPAEEYARSEAFYNFVSDPNNAVFVQEWGAVDRRYRWIDNVSGKVMTQVDKDADLWTYPESGWIALQIGDGGTYEEPATWTTTMTMKVEPGFVLGIDQAGYIFESGPAHWILRDAHFNAARTGEWSQEKIMDLLGAPDKAE